jgi:hypothetical protein
MVVKYWLRYPACRSDDVQRLTRAFSEYSVRVSRHFKDPGLSVVSVALHDGIDMTKLVECVRKNASSLAHEVIVSLSTTSETDMIEIPSHIVELIREIDGRLIFSFTCLPDRDGDGAQDK